MRGKVDAEFDDIGEQSLKNTARPLRVYCVRQGPAAESGAAALPLADKPSLAVLPFQNLSGDPGQEYFADGIVEEITTAISRLPWLFVIARNSSFAFKRQGGPVLWRNSLAQLGRIEEARQWLRTLLELQPGMTIGWYKRYGTMFMPPETLTVIVEGLRKAGLPEE